MYARVGLLVLLVSMALPAAGQDGAEFLVIARDEFAAAVKPLADWRHATGHPTRVVPTSVTGSSLEQIQAYVDSAYYNWPIRPAYVLPIKADALITLSLVFLLVISFYGQHAAEVAQGIEGAAGYMPVSGFVAAVFMSGIAQTSLPAYANAFWWVFVVALLGFMNYLAVTKHMHIVTAIPNCFFKSLDKVAPQPREEFKKGNTFGVGRVDQFGWKGLFDSPVVRLPYKDTPKWMQEEMHALARKLQLVDR